ncbi:uncharacterized protein LOC106181062 [Lingula anatina]|uniref:Uncharacterized protein LOC106181062 n=1 Tax=Lingula anatina TaxID=7574 RepID=A0A1S3KE92_LINAN|nr:uncharacterized protein LOC106181062 [Lingula anatina]|eukprot:XP_013420774.1 uncharacterized protein LOC106181062 [Lingula anatina]
MSSEGVQGAPVPQEGSHGGTPASRLTQRSVPASRAANMNTASRRGGSAKSQDTLATGLFVRESFGPAADFAIQNHLEYLQDYLQKTKLEEKFSSLCHLLFSSPALPYNPYPGFLRRLSPESEKFYMYSHGVNDGSISSNLESSSSAPSPSTHQSCIPYLVRGQLPPYVCGLRNLVTLVDTDYVQTYQWLLDDVTPVPRTLDIRKGYTMSVVAALCGPGIFSSTFGISSAKVKVRIEYFVTGKDINMGIVAFAESIAKDLWGAHSEGPHILLGINVPVQDKNSQDTWTEKLWTVKRMQNYSDEFLEAVKACTKAEKCPVAEFAFKVDPYTHIYNRGEKQYVLNFLEETQSGAVSPGDTPGRLTSFTALPLLTLHDGIFISHSKAEFYMLSHMPALADLEGDWDRPDVRASLQSVQKSQQESSKNKRRGWRAIFSTVKAEKVKTDGFKDMQTDEEKKLGPFGWQFVAPIKSYWERKIARMHLEAEVFDCAYYIVLLTLIESDVYPTQELHREVNHLMHCTAAKLHALMEVNRAVIDLIQCFQGYVEATLVDTMFMKYRNDVINLLAGSELQERSSAMHAASRRLTSWLDKVTYMDGRQTLRVSLKPKSIEMLQAVNQYCIPLLLIMTEDALHWCPQIKKCITSIKEKYPEEACVDKAAKEPSVPEAEQYVHGSEIEGIIQHDLSGIDVTSVGQGSMVPSAIAGDSVLLKYVSDTHLDETWQEFLLDLLSGGSLPPNPYPRLLTKLTEAANRMDVQYMTPHRVTEEVCHGREQLDEPDGYIFTIPGTQIYGTEGCLGVLDWDSFSQVIPVGQELLMHKYPHRKGPYRLAVCPAISGDTFLYGKMSPYLHSVCLHEYCFIRGPRKTARKALEWFADIVYHHLAQLYEEGTMVLYGVYMGTASRNNRWTLEGALNKRKQFETELIRHLAAKEPVYLKAYVAVEWRYIPVIKHFMLQFISEDENEYEMFYCHTPIHIHQSVFMDKEKASFYYQRCDPLSDEDPYSPGNSLQVLGYIDQRILEARKEADWVSVQKWILQKSIVTKKSDQIGESWYLFHSIAGRLEYLRTLIQSLTDLVNYGLEKEKSPLRVSRQVDRSRATLSSQVVQSPVDQSVMCRMVTAFRQKFRQVVTSRVALAAASLLDFDLVKLDQCMELDTTTNLWVPHSHEQVIATFEEVSLHLLYLQDLAAFSFYQSNLLAQATMQSVERKAEQRPESVYSQDMRSHSNYIMKPAAYVDNTDQSDHLLRPVTHTDNTTEW